MTKSYDIVIKDGTVFDGQQTPRFKADIGMKRTSSMPIFSAKTR